MLQHRLSLALHAPRLCAAIGIVVVLAACSSTSDDKSANWGPDKLYSEAKSQMDDGAYDKAVPLLDKLSGRAAGTPLAQQAEIDKAYAQYKANEPADAIASLDRFMKLHPASPVYDYALYLKGLANFNDNLGIFGSLAHQDLAERDQKAAKDSFESFKQLVTLFPNSRYAQDSRLRMAYIVNALARYEVHVARYYFSMGAYVAAANRAQQAVAEFPGVPAQEEALAIMMQSYDSLGMTQLRDDARRILEKNYPQSRYLSQAYASASKPWWKIW